MLFQMFLTYAEHKIRILKNISAVVHIMKVNGSKNILQKDSKKHTKVAFN